MKRLVNILYWSLPIVFAVVWFALTLVFTPIYDQYYYATNEGAVGLSPRVGMILLSPISLTVLVIILYNMLYIERKLLYNWTIVVCINILMMVSNLIDVIKPIIQTLSDSSSNDRWGYYHALEVGLKYIPFVLVSFLLLYIMRRRNSETYIGKKQVNYVLFYLLPLLYSLYVGILNYFMTDYNYMLGFLFMPICSIFLLIYTKAGKSRHVYNIITFISFTAITALWYWIYNNIFMENATRGIVLLCLMVIPWIISSHLIAHKYNLSQQN